MAKNGGILSGVPTTNRRSGFQCSECVALLDSFESFNVHMSYHLEQNNRWCAPTGPNKSTSSTASNSPTDSENNNQPKHSIHNIPNTLKSESPLNNTVSATADSSDTQPSATQPSTTVGQELRMIYGGYGISNTSSIYHQATHQGHFQTYPTQYQQYYDGHTIEYGVPPPQYYNSPPQQEYKTVPSNRYHPYMNQTLNPAHPSSINSTMSPRNVSSSSPTHSVLQSTTSSPSNQLIPINQPTSSPSPNQCDKCGHVCETASQLREHHATAHGTSGHDESSRTVGSNESTEVSSFPHYSHKFQQEQPFDIYDLDSQKLVYSPNGEHSQQGPLPSIQSLHLQRPLLWQEHEPVMFPTSLPTKQEFPSSVLKQEYIHHQAQIGQQQQDIKPFNSDVTGNQVTSSPSEFPSTTTPQENGAQFRTSFEAATSSLPTNAPSGKSSSWKSNEARRPKTYNCTACNKWFTSSGHLKRHYNTTLHKNALKSSGHPDPATMPISAHHHPSRDQNRNNHHHKSSPAQQLAQAPSETSRSPEYTSPPLGFQQSQGFQQYQTALSIHSTTGNSPNGQAVLSVPSHSRDLLILMDNTGTPQLYQKEEQQHTFTQLTTDSNITNSLGPYITNRTTINTTTTVSHQDPESRQNCLTFTGNNLDDPLQIPPLNIVDYSGISYDDQSVSSYNTLVPCNDKELRRYQGGVAQNEGDISRGWSPDTPHSFHPMIPQTGASQQRSPTEVTPQITTSTSWSTDSPHTFIPMISQTGDSQQRSPTEVTPQITTSASWSTDSPHTFIPMIPQTGASQQRSPTELTPQITTSTSWSLDTPHTFIPMFPQTGASHQRSPAEYTPQITTSTSLESPNEARLRCDPCNQVFSKTCYLTQHNTRFHSGEKPYKCQKCGKRFATDEGREIHAAKHTAKKPHKCEKCEKSFHYKTDLRRHTVNHTGEYPHVCSECKKRFVRRDHMRKHKLTHTKKKTNLAKKKSRK